MATHVVAQLSQGDNVDLWVDLWGLVTTSWGCQRRPKTNPPSTVTRTSPAIKQSEVVLLDAPASESRSCRPMHSTYGEDRATIVRRERALTQRVVGPGSRALLVTCWQGT